MIEKNNLTEKSLINKEFKKLFVARQPILDKNLNLYAYELLFRTGFQNFYQSDDDDYSTLNVILNSFILIGLDSLTGGEKAFINFTHQILTDEIASIFPNKTLVIEILENVHIQNKVIDICKKLKDKKYIIALDDYIYKEESIQLLELADIVKIDFLVYKGKERQRIVDKLSKYKLKFCAEKVETYEDYQQAVDYGYNFFQGFFFSKPTVFSSHDIPSHKFNHIEIIKEVNSPNMKISDLEKIIKRDVSMTYKLLKYINSAYFSIPNEIQSIKHALSLLGNSEIKKWITFIALSSIGDDKPKELIISSLFRAKFCELLSNNNQQYNSQLFLIGLLSLLDILIDIPMEKILNDLPLPDLIKIPILGGDNCLSDIFKLVVSYEKAQWNKIEEYSKKINIDSEILPELYLKSIQFANYSKDLID